MTDYEKILFLAESLVDISTDYQTISLIDLTKECKNGNLKALEEFERRWEVPFEQVVAGVNVFNGNEE